MSKEMTWVEAARRALENSDNVWMTAPDLVREIHKTGIRELKSAHPQAVRSLRSALNSQSRKENGLFSRREEEYSIYFALKRRLKGSSGGSKAPHKFHSAKVTTQVKDKDMKSKPQSTPSNQVIVNGLPPHPPPLPLHPLVPTQPYTIEIDPSLKYTQYSSSSTEPAGNFCLPSPSQSILGPIRTLHIFNESNPTNHRPVRQARMRKSLKDQENSSPDAMMINSTYEATPIQPTLAPPPVCEVLRLETCHPVPSLLSEVVCVRYPCAPNLTSRKSSVIDEDPCTQCKVQGERKCSGRFEIQSLDYYVPTSSESEFDDDDEDDDVTSMDTQSESEAESGDRVLLQPTPRQQLLIPKPLRRFSSSSFSEGLRADESLLVRETLQSESESIPSLVKQNRAYSVDLGRLSGANNSSTARATSRSAESRNLDGVMKKPSSNGYVPCATLTQLDQRRYVSSLFQPTSPLVGENMKLLLNMNAYKGLTGHQKRKLKSLLPSVDRGGIESNPSSISESSFNNAFFSSALREWQEYVALGSFTPEYKAKMRGEEKRRTAARAEELWKQKFYEDNWGDKKEGADDQRDSFPVPYYPHNQHQLATATPSSQHATDCLRTILDAYCGKDTKQEEPPSLSSNTTSVPPPPPPCDSNSPHSATTTPATPAPVIKPPPSTTTANTGTTGRKEKSVVQVSGSLNSPRKMSKTTKSSSTSPSKNHLVKKPPHSQPPGSKNLLPSLLKSKPKSTPTPATNKKVAVSKKTAVKRLGVTKSQQAHSSSSKSLGKAILHSMRNQSTGQYLTRLPPKLPYQTLLSALEQASKDNSPIKPNTSATTITPPYTPPSQQHTHSVFHDHFALLSNEHVPTEFSLPITSLPIQLPRDIYHICLRAKVVQREHSYSRPSTITASCGSNELSMTMTPPHLHQQLQKKQLPQEQTQRHRELSTAGLKLSLPRSLIKTKENCECDGRALVFCSRCHSLYHTECVGSVGTLCPRCVTIASLLGTS